MLEEMLTTAKVADLDRAGHLGERRMEYARLSRMDRLEHAVDSARRRHSRALHPTAAR